MAKGAFNLSILQKEYARHLFRILLYHANSVLEHRALQPAHPNRRIQEVQIRIGTPQRKRGQSIKRGLGIADPLHIRKMVVVEVGPGPLRRAEMHKDGPRTARLDLVPHLRNAIQSLRAEGAREMTQKDEQDRGLIHEIEQRSARLSMKSAQGVCEVQSLRWLLHSRIHPLRSTSRGKADYSRFAAEAAVAGESTSRRRREPPRGRESARRIALQRRATKNAVLDLALLVWHS